MACHKQSNYNNCGAIEYKACNRVGIEPYLLCIFRFQGIHNIKDHTQKNDSHTKADGDNKYGVQFSNKRHIHHGHIINIGSVAGDAAYAGGNVYCATKSAVKSISDGLRIDVVHTKVRVTNIKPGLVETNFSRVRFHGNEDRADKVYQGIKPLTGDDVADVVLYAVQAPEHVQIAEVLVLATHQASGSVIHRE